MEVYPPQVARPNVGYCRQLVDFEKTSTGWGGWWLGVGLENDAPLGSHDYKDNLGRFLIPWIQTEFQIHHGQQKVEKSEATNTKRKESNQTEGSSGLA